MIKKYFVLALILAGIYQSLDADACWRKRRKKKQQAALMDSNTKMADNASGLVVSFISFGSGIDFKSAAMMDSLMEVYKKNDDCALTVVKQPWGREGERDYCIHSQDSNCLKQIGADLQERFGKNDRIHIRENAPCKQRNP